MRAALLRKSKPPPTLSLSDVSTMSIETSDASGTLPLQDKPDVHMTERGYTFNSLKMFTVLFPLSHQNQRAKATQ